MMNGDLLTIALVTAGVSVVLAIALFLVKWFNWRRTRAHGQRRAEYVGAVGEIVARGLPHDFDQGWAADPLFHDVLMQYVSVVAGDERGHLEELIEVIDLRNRLVHQLRAARRQSLRMAAASYLAIIASPEIEWALIEALDSPNPEIKIQAAGGLATIKSERAIGKLVHMLLTEQAWVAGRIADQLVTFGVGAVPMLMENIRDEHNGNLVDAGTIAVAIRVLGFIGDRVAGPIIEPMLVHPDLEVRVAAANALATAGKTSCVWALADALTDPAWQVRARAAASLGAFSDGVSLDSLALALSDDSWWVRQNTAQTLTEVVGGIDILIHALDSADLYARDAALQQLGLSGEVDRARDRIAAGMATERDELLIAGVDLDESFLTMGAEHRSEGWFDSESDVELPIAERPPEHLIEDDESLPDNVLRFDSRAS